MKLLTGLDATPAANQPWTDGKYVTVLDATKHWDFWQEDYSSMKEAGFGEIRLSILMHDIIPSDGSNPEDWNWDRWDAVLHFVRDLGLNVILDLCHHDARPLWMGLGLSDPGFAELLTRFALECKKRYPWVTKFTLMNEPYPTTWFCTIAGVWYNFRQHDDAAFVRMAINIARAVCMASRALKEAHPDVEIYQNESCEGHVVADSRRYSVTEEDRRVADFCNQRSLLILDLMSGTFRRESHPLGWYVAPERGFTPEVEQWFAENPAIIRCLMLDYYKDHDVHAYHEGGKHLPPGSGVKALGFAELVRWRYLKYKDIFPDLELMIGETNLIGHDPDKLSWEAVLIRSERPKLQAMGVELYGMCHMGWTDQALWDSHLTKPFSGVVGVGYLHVDPVTFKRSRGLGFEVMRAFNRGEIKPEEFPFYGFLPPVDRQLEGFEHLFEGLEVTPRPRAYLA